MRKSRGIVSFLLKISFLFGLLSLLAGCEMFGLIDDDGSEEDNTILSLNASSRELKIGGMDIIDLKVDGRSQGDAGISWEFDPSVISAKCDNYGAVITGLAPGQTTLKAIYRGVTRATCLITVSSDVYKKTIENPYIYASTDFVSVVPGGEAERIVCSIYGGSSSDNNNFTYELTNPEIATITSEGNYVWVSGKGEGLCQLKIKNSFTTYPFTVLVSSAAEKTTATYLTTDTNVITLNKSENQSATLSVSIKNSTDTVSGFSYSIIDENGNAFSDAPVTINNNGDASCTITALHSGLCYIRCKHRDATYPLDVLVRVIEDKDTAYLNPSLQILELTGDETDSFSVELDGVQGEIDTSKFEVEMSDGWENIIDYIKYDSQSSRGIMVACSGKKTGSVKCTVSYPGYSSRTVSILVRNLKGEATKATSYITTSQNFITLNPGDETKIDIMLTDCDVGDIDRLHWKLVSKADDGSKDKVISWTEGTGDYEESSARSITAQVVHNENGWCRIKAEKCGSAKLIISHPGSTYRTTIDVKVVDKVEKEPYSRLTRSCSSYLKLLNGESGELRVTRSGDGTDSELEWKASGESFSLSASDSLCVINAPESGSGSCRATVTVSHKYSKYPVTFAVYSADTEEELEELSIKEISTNTSDIDVWTKSEQWLSLYYSGFNADEVPSVSWSIAAGSDCISLSESSVNGTYVHGEKSGNAIVIAGCEGCQDVIYYVRVHSSDIINEDEPAYMTTGQNSILLDESCTSQEIEITLFNLSDSAKQETSWSITNTSDFTLSGNGEHAVLSANTVPPKEAEAVINISNPYSSNNLQIFVKSGSNYTYINKDFCLINVDRTSIHSIVNGSEVLLRSWLSHTERGEETGNNGFTYLVSDSNVCEANWSLTNSSECYIRPKASGTSIITVRHPDAESDYEVLVVVDNEKAEGVPFLTTKNNVIKVVEGEYVTANVELENCNVSSPSDWSWFSSDTDSVRVIQASGSTCMLSGVKAGEPVSLTVSNSYCKQDLKIIVQCLPKSTLDGRRYIVTDSNAVHIKKGESSQVSVNLSDGSTSLDKYFNWSSTNLGNTVLINPNGSSCYIKGLQKGCSYITVNNSRLTDVPSKSILVVVEDDVDSSCYIKPSSSRIINMKPDSSSEQVVTCELVGGDAVDAQDFVWWADDYNMVALNAIAGQAKITPLGRSGATKVHVKHPKAGSVLDFLLLISDYDTFAFSESSASLYAGKMYFIPMNVPAVEDKYSVRYTSSDESILIAQGSESVACLVCRSEGNVNVKAQLMNARKDIIAESELLVSVVLPKVELPSLNVSSNIVTIEEGSELTLSASISGTGVSAGDRNTLLWTTRGKSENGITFFGQVQSTSKAGGTDVVEDVVTFTGTDCRIFAHTEGEYVITVTSEKHNASTDIYVKVPKKGETRIELSKEFVEQAKEDGSFELTANVINGNKKDLSQLEWTATKAGGLRVVSISSSKGGKCIVTPISSGSCAVYAKLPSGIAGKCLVTIKEDYKISLEYQTVKVMPGYTQKIKFTTVPQGAAVKTEVTCDALQAALSTGSSGLSMGTEWMNYVDISIDNAGKCINIYGKKPLPNTQIANIEMFLDGLPLKTRPRLQVYCDYDVQMELYHKKSDCGLAYIGSGKTDADMDKISRVWNGTKLDRTGESLVIKYFPKDLNINIGGEAVTGGWVKTGKVTDEEYKDYDGTPRYQKIIQLLPQKECAQEAKKIEVKSSLPAVPGTQNASQNCPSSTFLWEWKYKSYSTVITMKNQKEWHEGDGEKIIEGGWSKLNLQNHKLSSITLGDGEEIVLDFSVENEGAEKGIEKVYLKSSSGKIGYNSDQGEGNLTNANEGCQDWLASGKRTGIFTLDGKENYKAYNVPSDDQARFLYCTKDSQSDGAHLIYRVGHAFDYCVMDDEVWDYYGLKKIMSKNSYDINAMNRTDENGNPTNYLRMLRKYDLKDIDYFMLSKKMYIKKGSLSASQAATLGKDRRHNDNFISEDYETYYPEDAAYNGSFVGFVWNHTWHSGDAQDDVSPYLDGKRAEHVFGIWGETHDLGSWDNPHPFSNATHRGDNGDCYIGDWIYDDKYWGQMRTFGRNLTETNYYTKSELILYSGPHSYTIDSGCQSNRGTHHCNINGIHDHGQYANVTHFTGGRQIAVGYENEASGIRIPQDKFWANGNFAQTYSESSNVYGSFEIHDYDSGWGGGDEGNIYSCPSLIIPYVEPCVPKNTDNDITITKNGETKTYYGEIQKKGEVKLCVKYSGSEIKEFDVTLLLHPNVSALEKDKYEQKNMFFRMKK